MGGEGAGERFRDIELEIGMSHRRAKRQSASGGLEKLRSSTMCPKII
jgi:hypothetical protein